MSSQSKNELLISLFQSLIENSIKYSPKKTTVDIQVIDSEENIEVTVIDEGPGLGEKSSENLFERFSRGAKQEVAGSGLGLSIAKRISDLHGADISLKSQNPIGSKASFVIKKV